jgi:hypothetical protein
MRGTDAPLGQMSFQSDSSASDGPGSLLVVLRAFVAITGGRSHTKELSQSCSAVCCALTLKNKKHKSPSIYTSTNYKTSTVLCAAPSVAASETAHEDSHRLIGTASLHGVVSGLVAFALTTRVLPSCLWIDAICSLRTTRDQLDTSV